MSHFIREIVLPQLWRSKWKMTAWCCVQGSREKARVVIHKGEAGEEHLPSMMSLGRM